MLFNRTTRYYTVRAFAFAAALAVLVLGGLLVVSIHSFIRLKNQKVYFASQRPLFDQGSYLSDALLGWRLYPNYRVYDGPKEKLLFETDRYGFRNPHKELPESGKVILLGDSFVQGYYLSEDETIRSQLQEKLKAQIYNFGVGGYSTDQEFQVGRAALEKFQSDWMVLFFYNNDLPYLTADQAWKMGKSKFLIENNKVNFQTIRSRPFSQFNGEVFPADYVFPPRIRFREGASYQRTEWDSFRGIFAADCLSLFSVFDRNQPESKLELAHQKGMKAYLEPGVLASEWDLAFQFFVELKRLAQLKKTRVLIFNVPEYAQIKAGPQYFAPQWEFQKRCIAERMECLEPHLQFSDKTDERGYYFADDGHFAPPGAVLAADLVGQYIKENSPNSPKL